MSQFVLVSQGVEIGRFNNREEAEAIMKAENEEYYEYVQKCLDTGEKYADTEIVLYEE